MRRRGAAPRLAALRPAGPPCCAHTPPRPAPPVASQMKMVSVSLKVTYTLRSRSASPSTWGAGGGSSARRGAQPGSPAPSSAASAAPSAALRSRSRFSAARRAGREEGAPSAPRAASPPRCASLPPPHDPRTSTLMHTRTYTTSHASKPTSTLTHARSRARIHTLAHARPPSQALTLVVVVRLALRRVALALGVATPSALREVGRGQAVHEELGRLGVWRSHLTLDLLAAGVEAHERLRRAVNAIHDDLRGLNEGRAAGGWEGERGGGGAKESRCGAAVRIGAGMGMGLGDVGGWGAGGWVAGCAAWC
jgi:hypothetical protein